MKKGFFSNMQTILLLSKGNPLTLNNYVTMGTVCVKEILKYNKVVYNAISFKEHIVYSIAL